MSPEPIRVRKLTAFGLRFDVRSTGRTLRADPRSFVLVHGLGTSHRYMARLHRELARTGVVHSLDLVGFGGLPKSPSSPDVGGMADGIAAVLDRLGVRDAVLVGHSMGSQWVVELAVRRPDLARGVVVIGPVTNDRRRNAVAQFIDLSRDIAGEPPVTNALVLVDYLLCGPIWFTRHLRHMLEYRIEERARLLAVPLLVVRGGNDPIAKLDWTRRLRDAARRGSLVIVPGHRHNVQHSAPRAVASAISSFVRRAC